MELTWLPCQGSPLNFSFHSRCFCYKINKYSSWTQKLDQYCRSALSLNYYIKTRKSRYQCLPSGLLLILYDWLGWGWAGGAGWGPGRGMQCCNGPRLAPGPGPCSRDKVTRTPRSCTRHHHQCLRGEEARSVADHRPPVAALNIGTDWDINSKEDGLEESKDPKIPRYHCSYVMTRWMMMLRKNKFLVWSDGWSAITFLFPTLRNNELSYYLTLLWTQTYQNVERWVK